MATVTEAVRRLRIEATSTGVQEATRDAQALAGGMDSVAVAAQRQEKAVQSTERRFDAIQRKYDAVYRAQEQQRRVEMDLRRAQEQGLVTDQRRIELLGMAAERHGLAVPLINREAAALDGLTVAARANAAALNAQASSTAAVAARSRNLSFQLVDIGQALATAPTMGIYALQNLGFQVAQIGQLYAGQGGFNQAIKDSAVQVRGFVTRFAPLAALAGTVAAAFAGVTYEINRTGETSVGVGDVMAATFQVTVDAIRSELKPAIDFIGPYIGMAWDWIVEKTKWLGNTIINSFRAAASDIKFVFGNIPTIVEAAAIGAANGVIRGINFGVQKAGEGIDWLIEKANRIPGVDIDKIGGFQAFDLIDNPAAADLGKLNKAHRKVIESIMESDPLGTAFNAIAQRAREIASATDEVTGAAGRARDAWDGLRKVTGDTAEKLRERVANLGQSLGGIFRGLLDQTVTWKDAALSAIQSVLQFLNQRSLDKTGSGLFGGGLLGSVLGGFFGLANGGVLSGGALTPFASGGVVTRPTVFPMANGTGLMGEAGPEAIMPLRRAPNGRLGVELARGANNNQPMAGNGVSRVRIELGEGLKAEILDEANSGTIEIVRASQASTINAARSKAVNDMLPGGRASKGFQTAYGLAAKGRRAG